MVVVVARHGGGSVSKQRRRLDRPIDVLVSTPGRLTKHWDNGKVFLGGARFVAVAGVTWGRWGDPAPDVVREEGGMGVEAVRGAQQVVLTSATMMPAVKKMHR